VAGRAEQVDPFLNDPLYRVDDRADDLDDRVLVRVGFELRFERGAVGVSQIGVDVDLADPDPGGLLEELLQRIRDAVLRDRVAAVEVAHGGGVGVDAGLGDERRGTIWRGECLADLGSDSISAPDVCLA
jgi:hypothetical protein